MLKKLLSGLFMSVSAMFIVFSLGTTPVLAQTNGGGPWGDIDGYYTWEINGKGWTIYSQNGYSWVYDDYGNRTYLDSYGNKLYNVSAAAAKTISEMKLTYYTRSGNVDVYKNPNGNLYTVDVNGRLYNFGTVPSGQTVGKNDLVVKYAFNSADGYIVYRDMNGVLWFFGEGYYPYHYWGNSMGSYQTSGHPDKVFRYAYISSDNHPIYSDDAGRMWWFDESGAHLYSNGGGKTPSGQVNPGSQNVDWTRTNTMWVDGKTSVVYVGQYWAAPNSVSWCPDGMHLIGWDYAENTGYVRWKPGQFIKNTGSDLALYPVYSY